MISIAMATYNGEKYLREQVDSILQQSVQNFELVVGDDNSSDKTFDILEELAQKDKRIRIYKNSVNLGFKKNFESIIRRCQGEYVALCDQDDMWFPDHLEILQNGMTDNMQVVCGKPIFVDENNKELSDKYDYLLMYHHPVSNKDTARHIFLGRSTYQGASMLIRRSFFDKALPIPDGADYHDSWFAIFACFMDGFVFVDKPTMRYRRLSNSVTFGDIRISAARRFCASVVHDHTTKDRLFFIDAIRSRLKDMPPDHISFLNKMEKMIKRGQTFWGRVANVPYIICHFKAVFACDLKHVFS